MRVKVKSSVTCECGCGGLTNVAPNGQPYRFVYRHHRRKRTIKSYRQVGWKKLHRLRAEQALGRTLKFSEQVHHVDGSKSERSPLVICQDQTYHYLLHYRTRTRDAGGNPNTDGFCYRCETAKPISDFRPLKRNKASGVESHCRTCIADYYAAYWARRKNAGGALSAS